MIEIVDVKDLHIKIVDSTDMKTLWDGYTTYEALRESLIKCSEEHAYEVEFEEFPNVYNGEVCAEIYIMLSDSTKLKTTDLLPEIIRGL